MRGHRQLKYLPLLGLLASVGLVVSGIDIRNAFLAVKKLRTELVTASSAHDDLQFFMQWSHRSLVEATTSADWNERLSLIRRVRKADEEAEARLTTLSDLDLPDASQPTPAFRQQWQTYLETRDRFISLLQRGDSKDAVAHDAGLTSQAFESVATALQDIRRNMAAHAQSQATLVEATLFRLVFELGLLVLALGSFSWALLGSRTERNQEREKNEQLARNAKLDAQRSRVLEMTGKNEPLPKVLETICSLVQQQLPGSVAGVSVFRDGRLSGVLGPAIPSAFVQAQLDCSEQNSSGEGMSGANWAAYRSGEPIYSEIQSDPSWGRLRDAALGHGFKYCWSHPVRASSGQTLATVDVYFRSRRRLEGNEAGILSSTAQLASVVIEHRHLYDELAYQSQRDALTELPNRRLLQERLESTIAEAGRAGRVAAVLMIDLDWFKQVNDRFGHRAGDAVLQAVGQRLVHAIRQGDTVARVGGDEFTVVLGSISSAEEAERGARRILAKLVQPISLGDRDAQIAASIGVSMFPADGQDAATLIRHADLALYQVKSRGRHGVQLYGPQIGLVLRKRMSLETGLAQALQNGELKLHYQPQTDIHCALAGMEALIRWNSPEFGDVSPSEFVPVAEGCNLIVPIGSWALLEACRQGMEWQRAGFRPVKMAVNVSARQLAEANFVDLVRGALAESGLNAEMLELELTETTLMEHVEESLDRLRQLRALGVSMAIDDFGIGYSSLSYLQKLPVSSVKIDLSFVRDIAGVSTTIPVIQSIIDLAHGMGLKVAAEGVENEHQLQILRGLGCDNVQGYLVGRPVSASEAEAFLDGGTEPLLRLNREIGRREADQPAASLPAGSTRPARR